MNLKIRITNKIFKSYLNSSIEYHAGGFFVRKKAVYLIFFTDDEVYYYEREEGLHPNDNKYDKLEELQENEVVQSFKLSMINDNMLVMLKSNQRILIVPSIFIENLAYENLTEILVDWGDNKTQIFNCVYDKKIYS